MMAKEQAIYKMEKTMGDCVIFNIENFQKDKQQKRTGTKYDKDIIKETFAGFGYKTHIFENSTEEDIKRNMESVLGKIQEKSSSFICFILSHGTSKDRILTSDNKKMDLNEIVKCSDIEVLKGKPKIFVVQACRGNVDDRGEEITSEDGKTYSIEFDEMMPIVTSPDFLLIFATPPGYVSYRRPADGSPFIQMFCRVLKQHRSSETVCALLLRLVMTISCIPLIVENQEGWCFQVPFFASTLKKSLLLNPSQSETIPLPKISTIVHSNAELIRCRIIRLLQRGGNMHLDNADYNATAKSLYHNFLLVDEHGCYDLSNDKVRYCVVINKASVQKAESDGVDIENTMKHLKFEVHRHDTDKPFKTTFAGSLIRKKNEGKYFGCFFCFIQIDDENYESEKKELTDIIGTVKNDGCSLNKPKVFIIQRYKSVVENAADGGKPANIKTESVRYSKESDVLIVQSLPVKNDQESFIKLFCKEYKENAKAVCITGFLENVLPGIYGEDWNKLQPTMCSSLKKHLLMADDFLENIAISEGSDTKLCENLEKIAKDIQKQIDKSEKSKVSYKEDHAYNEEEESELQYILELRLTVFGRARSMISYIWNNVCSVM